MTNLLQDLRHHVRQLMKSPGFTFTAILSMTLGIGATTAVFSVIFAILMNPYPYRAADRIAHVTLVDRAGHQNWFSLTAGQWQAIKQSPVIEDAFAQDDWNLTLTGHDLPEDISATYLTANAFHFLGVPTPLGRGLLPSDAVNGQDPQSVAVLGWKFWQRRFASDPAAVGQTVHLSREPYTIIGVAPSRFWGNADVYLPLKTSHDIAHTYYVGVRLKPGITHDAADAALQPLIQQFEKETPTHFPKIVSSCT